MASANITNADLADIPELISVAAECRLSYWSPQAFADEFHRSDSHILCIRVQNGRICGFLAGRIYADIPDGYAEIFNIGVVPANRRQGLGSRLIAEFIGRCNHLCVEQIWLDVRASNHEAMKLYADSGFTIVSSRKHFYSDPLEDSNTMCLLVPKQHDNA